MQRKVVFAGQLSDECKSYLRKKQIKLEVIKAIIALTISAVTAFIGALLFSAVFGEDVSLIVFGIVMVVMLLVFAYAFIKSFTVNLFPEKVVVTDEEMVSYVDGKEHEASPVYIEEVVDKGNYWYFVWGAFKQPVYFICQKNLLVEGTLEDFEKIFEGKIVKDSTKND